MKTYLEVPFGEKDEARKLGAKWDFARRVWYVENIENLRPFLRWIPKALKAPTQAPRKFAGDLDAKFRDAAKSHKGEFVYSVGQRLVLVWKQNWRALEIVTVSELRRNGFARLSNGWMVGADGVLHGTKAVPGGNIAGVAP